MRYLSHPDLSSYKVFSNFALSDAEDDISMYHAKDTFYISAHLDMKPKCNPFKSTYCLITLMIPVSLEEPFART